MPVPSVMTDLSTNEALNSPLGADPIGTSLDNYLRGIQKVIRSTNAKGSDIASAATTDIGAATGEFVTVTGTTTITSFGAIDAGIVRTVHFSGALIITHNATSLILPGSANYTTVAGDVLQFRSLGSGNWRCVGVARASSVGLNTPIVRDNIAALEALTGMSNGALAQTLGYYIDNDGGHGQYRYDASSVATVNGFTVVSAAGGVGRWLLIEARPNLNQAGAKGDNSTNDQAAIQAACTAMSGKVIYALPGYQYKFNSNVSVPADTLIWAFGAKFNCSSSHFTPFTFVDGGGIVGAEEIKGAGNAAYTAGSIAIYCTGTNNSPAAPTYVDSPNVMWCKIKDFGEYGVRTLYTNKGVVKYNEFVNIGYSAYGGSSVNDADVSENYIDGISPGSGSGDAYGIFFSGGEGATETAFPRAYRCKANGNTLKNIASVAANNGHALDTHGGVECEFNYNSIVDCEGGIFITSGTIAGLSALGPKRCVAIGNTINQPTYNNYALIVRGAINGAVVADYADGNVVGQNTIFGGGVSGSNTTGSIMLQATKNTSLDIGASSQAKPFAVCLNSDNLNFNISGGTIIDPWDSSVTIAGGIAVRGNNNKGFIGGVTFKYENGALGTYVHVNSIVISGGLTGIDINYGKCQFEGIDATHLTFSDGVGTDAEGLFTARGSESFTLTSGTGSTTRSVTFAKRFPSIPMIHGITTTGAISPGNKTISYRTANVTAAGFDIIAYPYDLGNWTATGTLDLTWRATT